MPRLRFLRPSTGLGLEKRGIHSPIWPFIGRFYYLRLFAWLLPALISASLIFPFLHDGVQIWGLGTLPLERFLRPDEPLALFSSYFF